MSCAKASRGEKRKKSKAESQEREADAQSALQRRRKAATVYQNGENGLSPLLTVDQRRCLDRVTKWTLTQPHIEQGSQDWLFVRRFALTASNCADAVHCANTFFDRCPQRRLERYEAIEKVLLQKAALLEPFEGNDATRHGQLHEPVAVDSFSQAQALDVFLVGLLMHRRYAWLGASPDGVCSDGSLLEVKVPKSRHFKVGDPVPLQYWVQCQIQMEVTGAKCVHYYEYRVPSTSKRARIKEPRINHVLVTRNTDWFAHALPLLRAFVETMYRLRRLSRLYGSRWLRRERQMARALPSAVQRTSPLEPEKAWQ